jgi:hypothetical protein
MEVRAMIDPTTQQPIRVSTEAPTARYIRVSVEFLEKVRKLLEDNDVPHWVDHYAISVDGRPAMIVIHLRRKADPSQVQELLDATT